MELAGPDLEPHTFRVLREVDEPARMRQRAALGPDHQPGSVLLLESPKDIGPLAACVRAEGGQEHERNAAHLRRLRGRLPPVPGDLAGGHWFEQLEQNTSHPAAPGSARSDLELVGSFCQITMRLPV